MFKMYKFKEHATEACSNCGAKVAMLYSHSQCTDCKVDLTCCSMCDKKSCVECKNGRKFELHPDVEGAKEIE